MNIFRLLGDFSHLAAIVILLLKIWATRSCAGKSIDCIFFCKIKFYDNIKVYPAKVLFSMLLYLYVVIWIYFCILLAYIIRL